MEMAVDIAFDLTFIPLGIICYYGTYLDILVLFAFGYIRKQEVILDFLDKRIDPATVINTFTFGGVLFAIHQVTKVFLGFNQIYSQENGFPAKPMFFTCRTNHIRMFPAKHAFSYSYLMVGIPVGWKGSVGGMLTVDSENEPTSWYRRWFPVKAWFTVNSDDYFERGHVNGGLDEKLRNYLHSQGVDPSEFAHAYLFTAARFLNYASNPVSIWNLYSSTKELTATILEVNNTFDEKHSYFLRPETSSVEKDKSPKFSKSWPKDFYVSVFNSRAGSYSLNTNDALYPKMSGVGDINTTITLSSSSGSPKLIARLFSTEPGIDPSTMTVVQKVKFLASWWWVGLATFFPRTVFQALFILFKKKLPWAFRPEPRKDTLPRKADENEIFIEGIFRRYLQYFVEHCPFPLKVTYTPAGLVNTTGETMISPSAQLVEQDEMKQIELRVLTPLSYSRYVRYASCLQALISESQLGNSTICLSDPDLVTALANHKSTPSPPPTFSSSWEKLSFSILRNLRTEASKIDNCETKAETAENRVLPFAEVKQRNRVSELERFLLKTGTPTQRSEYIRRIGKMYVADRIAFGWAEILDLEVFMVKVGVLWWVVKTLV